jgi:Nucleotidyltransferase domain
MVFNQPQQLPEHVQGVITQLAADTSVKEIWLIGSQINGTSSPSSDWDLLVFANRDPSVREERCPGVDVLWNGPTRTLLEGQPESKQIDFNNFQWAEGDDGTAQYVARKFNEFGPGVGRDASTPLVLRFPQRARRIFPAPKNQ